MSYHIGQILQMDLKRGILGDALGTPIWNAIVVPPMKERATVERLKAKGCFAFFPSLEKSHIIRGKRIVREYPQITRIIYAKFKHKPNYDVMRARGLIHGVFSVGDRPINIPSEIVRRLQGLPSRVAALQQAREELQRLIRGDTAQLTEGPLAGHFVQVEGIAPDGRIMWSAAAMRGASSAGMLAKEGGPSESEVQARADDIMGGDG